DGQPASSANPKETKKPFLTDRYGDALPEGAIGRLGTVRFRHGFYASAIAFSSDGKTVASGGRYPGLRLWDAKTGRPLKGLPTYGAISVAFSPDSKTVVASSGIPILFDVASGKEIRRFPTMNNQDFVAFSPDGQVVAAEERDKINLWRVSTGKR